jgi:hypothetical protein
MDRIYTKVKAPGWIPKCPRVSQLNDENSQCANSKCKSGWWKASCKEILLARTGFHPSRRRSREEEVKVVKYLVRGDVILHDGEFQMV